MPVTTRSKSRLLSTAQAVELQLSSKPSKKAKQNSKVTKPASPKQVYRPRRAHSSTKRIPKGPYPPQDHGEREPLQIITKPSPPDLSNITKAFWPCQKCSCYEGIFEGLVDSCVACGHIMDDHEPHPRDPWNPLCDYICKREELVASVLQHARQYGVVVIRATPQVGKSILLKLLGHRIAHEELDLEPVYLSWENRGKRMGLPYEQYLEREEAQWREMNSEIRPHNPVARTVYLIDEAQGSYEEEGLWSLLKNHRNTRMQPLYILVCVYGAAGVSYIRDPNIESQAQRMHALQCIELRPSTPGSPCMLFRQKEVDIMARKFAIHHNYQLEHGVAEYLHGATDGHPGMVGLLLSHLDYFPKNTGVHMPQMLSPEFFHKLIIQHEDSFVEWLSRWGRGVWSPWCERYVENCLRAPRYCHLRLLDIKKALREVAMQPHGLGRSQKDFDAFAFCHKWGLLHTEQPIAGSQETIFTFASPLHRRVAYRRLFPGREPDAVLKSLSLQQICANAIARFSPSTLQNRRYSRSNRNWGIPEAAFQDELYSCLSLELHYLPILSEYSHSKDGRIDFYVADQKWGIEVLQCGNDAEMAEHTARFTTGGKYQIWDIMDDYIILNFCPRSALRRIKIEDEELRSHVFHVVIEADELTAEIYTHNGQLQKSWSLSEGRQRIIAEDFYDFSDTVSDTTSHGMPSQLELTQRERAMMGKLEEMERQIERQQEERRLQMEQVKEDMKLQMEREKEELRLQMEREKEEFRLQMEQKEDREKIAPEQGNLRPVRGRKRKGKR